MSGLDLSIRAGLAPVPARVSPYAVETRAVATRWAALGTTPGDARVAILDVFVRALLAATAWSDLDALYWLAAHSRVAARVNLINPGVHDLVEVDAANLSFVDNQGFAGNGSTSYLQTGINPSLGGFKYQQNDASMFVWSLTDSNDGGAEIGGSTLNRVLARAGGFLTSRGNAASTGTTAVADSLGLIGWSRNAADHYDHLKGAAVLTPAVAIASTGISNNAIRLCAGGTVFSTRRLAMAGIGRGVASKVAGLHAASAAQLTAVGSA